MMNAGTAGIGWVESFRADRAWLALALLLGVLLGSTLTALAVDRMRESSTTATVVAKQWPHRALDREWRGMRTPVDVDRMFPRRR